LYLIYALMLLMVLRAWLWRIRLWGIGFCVIHNFLCRFAMGVLGAWSGSSFDKRHALLKGRDGLQYGLLL
jgi:hypothetical protein